MCSIALLPFAFFPISLVRFDVFLYDFFFLLTLALALAKQIYMYAAVSCIHVNLFHVIQFQKIRNFSSDVFFMYGPHNIIHHLIQISLGGIFSCLSVQMFVLPTPKTKWTFHLFEDFYIHICVRGRAHVKREMMLHTYLNGTPTHRSTPAMRTNRQTVRACVSNNDTAVKWKIVYVDFN